MSEREEFKIEIFEDFIGLYVSPFCQTPTEGYTLDDMKHSFNAGIEACAERKDAELAALRGFAKDILSPENIVLTRGLTCQIAKQFYMLDENGKPTKLLTGE